MISLSEQDNGYHAILIVELIKARDHDFVANSLVEYEISRPYSDGIVNF